MFLSIRHAGFRVKVVSNILFSGLTTPQNIAERAERDPRRSSTQIGAYTQQNIDYDFYYFFGSIFSKYLKIVRVPNPEAPNGLTGLV